MSPNIGTTSKGNRYCVFLSGEPRYWQKTKSHVTSVFGVEPIVKDVESDQKKILRELDHSRMVFDALSDVISECDVVIRYRSDCMMHDHSCQRLHKFFDDCAEHERIGVENLHFKHGRPVMNGRIFFGQPHLMHQLLHTAIPDVEPQSNAWGMWFMQSGLHVVNYPIVTAAYKHEPKEVTFEEAQQSEKTYRSNYKWVPPFYGDYL